MYLDIYGSNEFATDEQKKAVETVKQKIMTVTLNPCIDKTITINGFCEGGLNRTESVRTDAGGKGINVAKVLRGFEADTLAVGIMGNCGHDVLLNELTKRDIQHDFLFAEGTVRTNYKLFDREKKQVTEINETGFTVTPETQEDFVKLIEKYLLKTAVLVLSGSLAPGIPKAFYARLIRLAHDYQVKTILDADGEALAYGIEAAPYVIKPNLFELEKLYGKPFENKKELFDFADSILSNGVSSIVLSLGGDGALYLTQEETLRVHLKPIVCQSTVGAGDSMVAATAYSILNQQDLFSLAKLASSAGTVTASKPGTEVCTHEEVLAYQKQLTVEKVR